MELKRSFLLSSTSCQNLFLFTLLSVVFYLCSFLRKAGGWLGGGLGSVGGYTGELGWWRAVVGFVHLCSVATRICGSQYKQFCQHYFLLVKLMLQILPKPILAWASSALTFLFSPTLFLSIELDTSLSSMAISVLESLLCCKSLYCDRKVQVMAYCTLYEGKRYK